MIENLDQNQIIFIVTAMAASAVVVGFMAGFFGIGGGLIMVPILFYLFSFVGIEHAFVMHVAIGTSFSIIIPNSIALAQAANESGWGTSRFALEGNALFGQWTWSKKGISPKNKDPDPSHKILQFQILKASVRAYKNNLNTHNAYKEFREVRARLRQDETQITGLDLTKYLKNYAAIGEKYVAILEDIIKKNSLTDFDKANLLPTKLKQGIAL